MEIYYFKDIYGSTASIRKWGKKWLLKARNLYGDIYHKGSYASYKAARIALGHVGECWEKR